MEKFVPYGKLSKKKRRELDARKRGSWGGLNPVTRKPPNPKAYNRKKARRWDADDPASLSFFAHAGAAGGISVLRLYRKYRTSACRRMFLLYNVF